MILVGYHKTGTYRLFNLVNSKIVVRRYIVVDDNYAWDLDSNDTTNKPMMSNNLYGESSEQDEAQVDEPHLNGTPIVEEDDHKHGNEVVQKDVAATTQRPQRTITTPT